ncbi:phosphonate C-P lyase system protein PhnG [Devosia insulae DS-56]|uniref:Phosphonate C-P lyase system protein PhnG n=1 Tax=Devosia insulae DS-56 TaxID=1116389 RepID=A0A1E5XUZ7_9HYPH|nr:phosphonate C-P lyase system protein PhnG [Devosia insulae]OEO32405.1 phosphonate C-P lyase system protein PhnG [Devosia insulae DS-56]
MFDENAGGGGRGPSHAEALNVLARAEPAGLKALAEQLLERLGDIEVLGNRTGLVMVPMRDTVENVDFHLGEVLVSEAHITDAVGAIGYGMITGRDLERAMAMAVVDLALATDIGAAEIETLLTTERRRLAAIDEDRMRRVEATRVEMETF